MPVKKQTNQALSILIGRIKAFIIDMFMMMMPIMYATTYVFLDGKNDFQTNEIARWITPIIFATLVVVLVKLFGQTPGLKAYNLRVVNKENKNPTWKQSFLRYCIFLVCGIFILPLFFPFLRKDRQTVYDLLTKTKVIVIS